MEAVRISKVMNFYNIRYIELIMSNGSLVCKEIMTISHASKLSSVQNLLNYRDVGAEGEGGGGSLGAHAPTNMTHNKKCPFVS